LQSLHVKRIYHNVLHQEMQLLQMLLSQIEHTLRSKCESTSSLHLSHLISITEPFVILAIGARLGAFKSAHEYREKQAAEKSPAEGFP
jgi:hypothetical protein